MDRRKDKKRRMISLQENSNYICLTLIINLLVRAYSTYDTLIYVINSIICLKPNKYNLISSSSDLSIKIDHEKSKASIPIYFAVGNYFGFASSTFER